MTIDPSTIIFAPIVPVASSPLSQPPTAKAPVAVPAQSNEQFFQEMHDLLYRCDPNNKHAQAIVLAKACIDQGLTTRREIIAVARHLGFKLGHIIITLEKGTGDDPARHHWSLSPEGVYRNLN